MKTAVIILGHGSRGGDSGGAVQRIAADVKKLGRYEIVEHAFLQYATPTLHDSLDRCFKQKPERIVIVPFFTQSGVHVTRNIPELVDKAKKRHPGIEIVVTDYVGSHPHMAKIVEDLVEKSSAECGMRNAE